MQEQPLTRQGSTFIHQGTVRLRPSGDGVLRPSSTEPTLRPRPSELGPPQSPVPATPEPVPRPTATDPAKALQARRARFDGIESEELIERLMTLEEERAEQKLQAAKRMFHFLNRRLEEQIKQWKQRQAGVEEYEPGPGDPDEFEGLPTVADLEASIANGRRSVEEALQMTLPDAPASEDGTPGTPAGAMPLVLKARFQGSPASTLKAINVSRDWQGLLAKQDPLINVAAGPAQQWLFSLPQVEHNDANERWCWDEAPHFIPPPDPHAPPLIFYGTEAEGVRVPVGMPLLLQISASDADGKLDPTFASSVLLEAQVHSSPQPYARLSSPPPPFLVHPIQVRSAPSAGRAAGKIDGLGFNAVRAGRLEVKLSCSSAMCVDIIVQDGARHSPPLSTLLPADPVRVTFYSRPAVKIRLSSASTEGVAGQPMEVRVHVLDELDNVASDVNGEIVLDEASQQDLGLPPAIALSQGEATVQIVCRKAGERHGSPSPRSRR